MENNIVIKASREKLESVISDLYGSVVPDQFKISRDAFFQLEKSGRDLLEDILEQGSGIYVVSGLTRKISELDFECITLALPQILWNQSVQQGNADINSGVDRIKAQIESRNGDSLYTGNIIVSLNELCRKAYGIEPTTEAKKKMISLITSIDSTPIKINRDGSGEEIDSYLFRIMNKFKSQKNDAVYYHLALNPIFSKDIRNQYGEIPQDTMKRLAEKTKRRGVPHIKLIKWLGIQDKRTPHKLKISTLAEKIRMESYLKENRGKAEKKILSICDTMIDIGLIKEYKVEWSSSNRKKNISSITFIFNPSTSKKPNS